MRFVCISDTHNHHRELKLPEGDVLIHAGDFCHFGTLEEIEDFNAWLKEQSFKWKVLVLGNHDDLEYTFSEGIVSLHLNTACYDGICISGYPYPDLESSPDKILSRDFSSSHILLSHEPPKGCLDDLKGDEDLHDLAGGMKNLKVHIFGHVHGHYGIKRAAGTCYINAALCNKNYELIHPPIVFDFDGEVVKIIKSM